MKLLWRILIVLTFALLGMQSASACEHADAPHALEHANAIHRMGDSQAPCHHDHAFCCSTACGAHCCALLSGIGASPRVTSSDVPVTHSDPQCAGITRAPPVRPPIV
jgi:hypothetical protein